MCELKCSLCPGEHVGLVQGKGVSKTAVSSTEAVSSNLGFMVNTTIYFGFPLSDPLVLELFQTQEGERESLLIVLPPSEKN